MSATISSINYCPVKSVSFQTIEKCEIKKNIGIIGDRVFAFAKDLDSQQAKLFEISPDKRKGKWNKVLTLKNSPALNKYNFVFKDEKLTFTLKDQEILTIDINQLSEREALSSKITELESSLKQPIVLEAELAKKESVAVETTKEVVAEVKKVAPKRRRAPRKKVETKEEK